MPIEYVEIKIVGLSIDDERVTQIMKLVAPNTAIPIATPVVVDKPKQVKPETKEPPKMCNRCGGTDTPMWRKNDKYGVVCNACGMRIKRAERKAEKEKDKIPAKANTKEAKEMQERLSLTDRELQDLINVGIDNLDNFMETEPSVIMKTLEIKRSGASSLIKMASKALEREEMTNISVGKKPAKINKKRWQHNRFTEEHWFVSMWERTSRIVKTETKVLLKAEEVVRLFRDEMMVNYNLTENQIQLINTVGRTMAEKTLSAINEIVGPTKAAWGDDILMLFQPEFLPDSKEVWEKIRA
jgi:hypothetical protein